MQLQLVFTHQLLSPLSLSLSLDSTLSIIVHMCTALSLSLSVSLSRILIHLGPVGKPINIYLHKVQFMVISRRYTSVYCRLQAWIHVLSLLSNTNIHTPTHTCAHITLIGMHEMHGRIKVLQLFCWPMTPLIIG